MKKESSIYIYGLSPLNAWIALVIMLLGLTACASQQESFPVPEDTIVASPHISTPSLPVSAHSTPFGTVTVLPDFEVNGKGNNIDSIAFWNAAEPSDTLMFVTAKSNELVEVWKYPFVNNELPPLTNDNFRDNAQVNGIAVDQENDLLYVSVGEPVSSIEVFSLPNLELERTLIDGSIDLQAEPNITLFRNSIDRNVVYVSNESSVYIFDTDTGELIRSFDPVEKLETLVADDFNQIIYIPDENNTTGIYAYYWDGTPFIRNNTNNFGRGVFQADAEGVLIYTCVNKEGKDNGNGVIVAADQLPDQTEFEVFDRQTWEQLGTFMIDSVSNTDGIASTQMALPGFPSGIFVAINDDTSTVGVGWDKIFEATGLSCT